MDCLEFMKQVPDNYFDLVLTDPPYGIGASNERFTPENETWVNKKKVGYVEKQWDEKVPEQEYFDEIIRISKNQIIWGANYFGLKGGYIFWDKKETMPTYSKGELAWCSMINRVEKYEYLWSGYKKAHQEKRTHPTQKPARLFELIITDYTEKGHKIFDPFMGSGTTAVACQSLGLDWCGCELEADYVAIANKRLEAVQGSLF
jgi:site-specific DNA-methyltransferase (adenine-specific)